MKTSARNQFQATVHAVHDGAVNSEVILDLQAGGKLVAIVTKESARALGLTPGQKVLALVKASWPILVVGPLPKTSARNHLAGAVKSVVTGAVETEVAVQVAGGPELVVMITKGSEKDLALKVGDAVGVLIKASHVILAVD